MFERLRTPWEHVLANPTFVFVVRQYPNHAGYRHVLAADRVIGSAFLPGDGVRFLDVHAMLYTPVFAGAEKR